MIEPLAVSQVTELVTQELEWIEWKQSWWAPDGIGKYVSALSNAAAIHEEPFGYLVWGMNDAGSLVGTNVDHRRQVGGQPFEHWLKSRVTPKGADVRFARSSGGLPVLVMSVAAATIAPTRFDGIAYVRVGTATPKLHDHHDLESRLIQKLAHKTSEDDVAARDLSDDEVLDLLDGDSALKLLNAAETLSSAAVLDRLAAERIIVADATGRWSVTTGNALLFARNLGAVSDQLARKAPRLVFYQDDSRTQSKGEITGVRGYGPGFSRLMGYLDSQLPRSEVIKEALRADAPLFPIEAVRELVANALIHQDLAVRGAGPMIEVFSDRIEITNPGKPLISLDRLIDEPPRSRNERIAQLMRRMRICEERGSGIDKVVSFAEVFQLPPPDFRTSESSTISVLFAPRSFAQMTSQERIRAAYQHACLLWVSGSKPIGNTSLRKRFGLLDNRAAQVSRVLSDGVEAGLIKPADPRNKSRAQASYVPYWA